jgi:hypothetical protein
MLFTFHPSTDYELVRKILSSPGVFGPSSDDGITQETFRVSTACEYVMVYGDGELLGCYALVPYTSVAFEVHIAMLRLAWGLTQEITDEFFRWIWMMTKYVRITARIPTFNRLVLRLAKCCGMFEFGCDERCIQKNGRLYDEILLGISRPEMT